MGFSLLPIFFFFFSMFSLSTNLITPLPSLLSLNCISPPDESNPHLHYNISPIKVIFDNLTSGAPNSQSSTTVFGPEQYIGFMQCRTGLSLGNCIICTETARNTILGHCKNSKAVSAWFDGCYVQISSTSSYSDGSAVLNKTFNYSCSGQAENHDPTHFLPALETLLLKLRADITITPRHGFSNGEIQYENSINGSDSKIYGLVECVRLLSPQECDSCIAKAIDELYSYCGGENGGTVVYGQCAVRFDSSEFYHAEEDREANASSSNFTVWEGEKFNGGSRRKVVVVMACWGGGVSCFVVVVFSAWLLRRSVFNRAKVGSPGSPDFDEK